jgi:hypothetical protein
MPRVVRDAVVQRNYWRDVAQHYAIPRDEYAPITSRR